MARDRIVRGGKRSGKSVSVAMQFASMVLGIPITRPDGTKIPLQYPVSTPKNPLQYWIIGYDTSHAATIHRLLFQAGMGGTLKCIWDPELNDFRMWNKADPADQARAAEAELCEPIIPQRCWHGSEQESFAWSEAKSWEFSLFKAHNGALVYYWPSSARNPKQGEAVAGIWIDEDIQVPGHLREWQDRLTDHGGWFLWSAWPHDSNEALGNLLDEAELHKEREKPRIQSFQLIMSQNPFLTSEAKGEALDRMGTEEEIASRDRGETRRDRLVMYDYQPKVHLLRLEDAPQSVGPQSSALEMLRWLAARPGGLPAQWTRYLSIDPSNTRTACHSFAVPPAEWSGVFLGAVAVVEWELVMQKASAEKLADALQPLMGTRHYEAFIMDQMIGRQTNTGRDEAVFDYYRTKFEAKGLRSRLTHSGFLPGCNVPPVRYRAIRELMAVKDNGIPQLMFIERTTLSTQREFGTYKKKVDRTLREEHILDQPANPRVHDCMSSLEYGGAYLEEALKSGSAYQEPEVYGGHGNSLWQRAQKIRAKHEAGSYMHFGPGQKP